MQASIIIPTYNRANLLNKTLTSILNQTILLSNIEVIICDDGSSDNTRDVYERFKDRLNIHYIFQEDKGFRAGAARNLGIQKAISPICIFIDAGILLSSQAIENHIDTHCSSEEEIAILGYVYGFDDYSKNDTILEKTLKMSDNIDAIINRLKDANVVDVRETIYEKLGDDISSWPAPWIIFWSSNISIKTDVLKRIGGFDEWYSSWGGEDTDLALALFTHNVRIVLNRNCDSVDYPHDKLNNYSKDPELAEKQFQEKLTYMDKKYNLTAIKVWHKVFYDKLNDELIARRDKQKKVIWHHDDIRIDEGQIFSYVANHLKFNEKISLIDKFIPGENIIDFKMDNFDELELKLLEYASQKLGKDSIVIKIHPQVVFDITMLYNLSDTIIK